MLPSISNVNMMVHDFTMHDVYEKWKPCHDDKRGCLTWSIFNKIELYYTSRDKDCSILPCILVGYMLRFDLSFYAVMLASEVSKCYSPSIMGPGYVHGCVDESGHDILSF